MTTDLDLDRRLGLWLGAEAIAQPPDDLLARSLARVERTWQRPGWAVGNRVEPPGSSLRPTFAPAWLVLLVIALAIVGLVAAGSHLFERQPSLVPLPSPSTPAPAPESTRPSARPSAGTSWHAVGDMLVSRDGWNTATLLLDGRVLIAGGHNLPQAGDPASAEAELYDPTTGRWTATGSMTEARESGHAAALLPDGTVLVVGGQGHGETGLVFRASAELFDPATGRWSATGALPEPRTGLLALPQRDGSVVVVGGFYRDSRPAPIADRYDPGAGRWARVALPAAVNAANTAEGGCLSGLLELRDGRFLILCGSTGDGNMLATFLFDPATGSTTTAAPPVRRFIDAALLNDGRVLVTDTGAGEIFDPTGAAWSPAGLPAYPGSGPSEFRITVSDSGQYYESDTVTALADGTVLITIGSAALVYDPGR